MGYVGVLLDLEWGGDPRCFRMAERSRRPRRPVHSSSQLFGEDSATGVEFGAELEACDCGLEVPWPFGLVSPYASRCTVHFQPVSNV